MIFLNVRTPFYWLELAFLEKKKKILRWQLSIRGATTDRQESSQKVLEANKLRLQLFYRYGLWVWFISNSKLGKKIKYLVPFRGMKMNIKCRNRLAYDVTKETFSFWKRQSKRPVNSDLHSNKFLISNEGTLRSFWNLIFKFNFQYRNWQVNFRHLLEKKKIMINIHLLGLKAKRWNQTSTWALQKLQN